MLFYDSIVISGEYIVNTQNIFHHYWIDIDDKMASLPDIGAECS